MNKSNESKIETYLQAGRRELSSSGASMLLHKHLKEKIDTLNFDAEKNYPVKGDFGELIAQNWIEELLRFLAIKSIHRDYTKPFQIAPSKSIRDAWKLLMFMPKIYVNVCVALGNDRVLDHDPSDNYINERNFDRLIAQYNRTVEIYEAEFCRPPPSLFWTKPKIIPSNISEHIFVVKNTIKNEFFAICKSSKEIIQKKTHNIMKRENRDPDQEKSSKVNKSRDPRE